MIRYAVAQVVAHRLRFALTVLAIVLGVAFSTGALVLNDTAQQRFDDQFRTASAGVDLTVRTATAFDSGMGVEVERDPIPAGLVGDIRAVDGVDDAVAVAKGAARLESGGTDLGQVALSSWVDEPMGAYPVREGRAPTDASEFALDARTAERLDLAIGDRVDVVGDALRTLEVVGLVGFGDEAGPPTGSVAIASIGTVQQVLSLDADEISEVLVATALPPAELQPALARAVGDDREVATAQDLATAGAEAAAANLEVLQVVLVAMAIASLVIGAFLIANTFAIVVAQRTRELALLRATGATGRQVLAAILVEAVVIGVLAAVLGTLAGIAAAGGLRSLAAAFGSSIPEGDLVIEPRTVLIGAAVGIVVTLAAAVAPGRRAASVSPLLALRRTAAEPARIGRARRWSALAAVLAGAALSATPLVGAPVLALVAGLALVLVGTVLGAPLVAGWFGRTVARAVDRFGVPGRLARESVVRAPRRAASTFVALALGLAVMVFVAVLGASVKQATAANYREIVTADAVIESAGQEMLGGVHAAVFDELADVDEVGFATRLRYGHWRDGGMTSALTALDPDEIGEVVRLRMVDGSLDALDDGGVVIAERVALERDLAVGDLLPMTFARNGERSLPVVGVIEDAGAQALMTDYFVSLDTYAREFTEDMDASLFVLAADGVGSAELQSALEDALTDHPTVQVRDQAAVVAGRTKAVDQIFGLVTVLMLLALVIAVLGVANTLALSISERTRELGLLRAVGMRRGQVALMVELEALVITALAITVGAALGLGAAFATIGALGAVAPLAPVVPVAQVLGFGLLIAVAGAIAGIAPARRASRVPVLEAIADA